jgi:hypothetical protein
MFATFPPALNFKLPNRTSKSMFQRIAFEFLTELSRQFNRIVSYEPLFENPVNNIGELHVQLYLNFTIFLAYSPA